MSGDKSMFGFDTPNPWTKSLYNTEAFGSSSTENSLASFLSRVSGTEIIPSGTVITLDTVQANTILAFQSLKTGGLFQTTSLSITGSAITSSDNSGISITPFTGTSTVLQNSTVFTGVANSTGIFRVGTNPNYIFVADPITIPNSVTVNADAYINNFQFIGGTMQSTSNMVIQSIASGDGNITLTPSHAGQVYIGSIGINGNTIKSSGGILFDPGSGNVNIYDRLYLQHSVGNISGYNTLNSDVGLNLSSNSQNIYLDSLNVISSPSTDCKLQTNRNLNLMTMIAGMDINLTPITGSKVHINTSTESTSITTGVLVVDGGVGIQKNLYVGGNLTTLGSQSFYGIASVLNTSNATSYSSGALIIYGGASIAKDFYVNGNSFYNNVIHANANIESNNTTSGSIIAIGGIGLSGNISVGNTIQNFSGNDASSTSTGSIITNGGVGIQKNLYVGSNTSTSTETIISTTDASDTLTGALQVFGGASIRKKLYVGGSINADAGLNSTSITTGSIVITGGIGISQDVNIGGNINIGGYVSFDSLLLSATIEATDTSSGTLQVRGGAGIGKTLFATNIHTVDASLSTSATTGSLVVAGGIGINGNIYVAKTDDSTSTTTGVLNVIGGAGIGKNLSIGGQIFEFNTNDTTSASTGAIVVSGGIGVTKSVFISKTDLATSSTTGALIVTGGIGVGGNILVTNTSTSSSTSTGAIVVIGGLGVGGTGNIFDLNVIDTTDSSSSTTGSLQVNGGCGIGKNLFVNNDTTTDTFRITSTDNATSQTTGSAIISGGIGCAKDIYCSNLFATSSINTDILTKYTSLGTGITISAGSILTINDTTDATSMTTGSLHVKGGIGIEKSLYANSLSVNTISISSTTDSTDTGTGAMTVAGGVGIAKTLNASTIHAVATTQSSDLTTGSLVVGGGVGIAKAVNIGGNTTISSGIDSSGTDTGSLIVTGGLGMSGKAYIGGNVNISATTPCTAKTLGALTVVGGVGISGDMYVSSVFMDNFEEFQSDRKHKTNIDYDIFGTDFVEKLKPCAFNFKKNPYKTFGFIAQDVEETMKDLNMSEYHLVSSDETGLRLSYIEFIPILMKSVQELNSKVKLLENEIKILKENK